MKEETDTSVGGYISFICEKVTLIFVGALLIFMLVAIANISFIGTILDSDLALILAFVLPLICVIGLFLVMASEILRRLVAILGFVVIPFILPLVMFIVMLGLSSSLLSVVAGSDGADLLTSVKAMVLLFLIPPFAINLFIAWILLTQLCGAGGVSYSGAEAFIQPLLYPVFAAIGAILGAVGFFIGSFGKAF